MYLVLGLKQKEIEDEAQRILSKYLGNYTALYDLIKYDEKDCSFEDRRKSFRKLMPCSIPQIIKALSEVCYEVTIIYLNYRQKLIALHIRKDLLAFRFYFF